MPKPDWVGFILPARLMTDDEVDLLSPTCDRCNLTAVVVEAQAPFKNKRAATQPLIEFGNDDLKFYCSFHAPIDVPDEASSKADREFFDHINQQVSCPKYDHRRYASNCIRYNPNCLKRCGPIKQLLGGLPIGAVKERAGRGRKLYLAEKEMRKENES
ncbi:MAG: hypothetical protein ACYTEQ_15235 [Planctomycetota bacterium]|jgi:hypothetical protein